MIHSAIGRKLSLVIAALALLVTAVGANATAPATQSQHASHMLKCATLCSECQVQCDSCFSYCATLVSEGKRACQMHEYVCRLRGMLQDVCIALCSSECTQRVCM